MTAGAVPRTAKIIPFPKGGRAGYAGVRDSARKPTKFAALQTAWVPCAGVSYHEEAIREDARTRNRRPWT